MARLDPELRYLLDKYQASVAAGTVFPEAETPIRAMIYYTGDAAPLIALGFAVDSYHDGMAAGQLYLRDLAALSAHPNAERILKMRSYYPTLNDSIPKVRANQAWSVSNGTFTGFTGKGVIVGIIDTGIDYRHKAFQVGGKSRILRIWDQSATLATEPSTGKQVPKVPTSIVSPKGVEYEQNKINDAIASANPLSIVGQMDIDGHGTHVAGIAAGNGSQNGACHGAYTYIGVAPEADLIIVKLDHFGKLPRGGEGGADDDDMLNAMRYIAHHASLLLKRAAINMSIGGQLGSRDGQVSLDQQINSIQMTNKATIVTVIAASNEGNNKLHTHGTVPANGFIDIEVDVSTNSDFPTRSEVIEIWFAQAQNLTCAVQPNGGSFTTAVDKTHTQNFPGINNGGDVTIDSTNPLSTAPAESFVLLFIPLAGKLNKTGTWKIKLTNPDPVPVPFHAWIDTNGTTGTTFKSPTSACTLGTPGTAQEAITVGSFGIDNFLGIGDGSLSSFSSRGPTRNGAFVKPDLTAPGENITAPGIATDRNDVEDYLCFNCCCDCCADFYVDKQGTSMAAPHVTGAVALILQKNPSLNHSQVRNKLNDNAIKDGDTGSVVPNDNWGFGKLDVKAALDTIIIPPASPTLVPTPTPITALPHRQLIDLQERFIRSNRGTEWRGVIRSFAQEINRLINSNKRVATVWHRNGGPAWVRIAFQMAATPTMPLPETTNGYSLQTGIEHMLAIVKRYGSETLVQWLTQNEHDLALIQPGRSLLQLLDSLDEPVHAV